MYTNTFFVFGNENEDEQDTSYATCLQQGKDYLNNLQAFKGNMALSAIGDAVTCLAVGITSIVFHSATFPTTLLCGLGLGKGISDYINFYNEIKSCKNDIAQIEEIGEKNWNAMAAHIKMQEAQEELAMISSIFDIVAMHGDLPNNITHDIDHQIVEENKPDRLTM